MPTTTMRREIGETTIVSILSQTANNSVKIPAGYGVSSIYIINNTSSIITGGIKIGTTDGGTDVLLSQAVGSLLRTGVADNLILKKVFDMANETTLYINAIIAWGGANIDVHFGLIKLGL